MQPEIFGELNSQETSVRYTYQKRLSRREFCLFLFGLGTVVLVGCGGDSGESYEGALVADIGRQVDRVNGNPELLRDHEFNQNFALNVYTLYSQVFPQFEIDPQVAQSQTEFVSNAKFLDLNRRLSGDPTFDPGFLNYGITYSFEDNPLPQEMNIAFRMPTQELIREYPNQIGYVYLNGFLDEISNWHRSGDHVFEDVDFPLIEYPETTYEVYGITGFSMQLKDTSNGQIVEVPGMEEAVAVLERRVFLEDTGLSTGRVREAVNYAAVSDLLIYLVQEKRKLNWVDVFNAHHNSDGDYILEQLFGGDPEAMQRIIGAFNMVYQMQMSPQEAARLIDSYLGN